MNKYFMANPIMQKLTMARINMNEIIMANFFKY
jgi:hypothetical protein